MFQDETLDIDVPITLASECKISEYASYTSYTETAGACRRTDDQQGGVFSGVSQNRGKFASVSDCKQICDADVTCLYYDYNFMSDGQ